MNNLKQLFRRYNDGTLIARNDNYDRVEGYHHVQSTPSKIWTIKHAKGSTSFSINTFVDDVLVKCETEIIDNCNIMLIFTEETVGFVNLLFLIDPENTNNCS